MRLLFISILLTFGAIGYSQKGVTTFGIQYKPIIPNKFIGTYTQDFSINQLESSIKQKYGNVFGMVVRHGFTKNISIETGINYTQRNFNLYYDVPDSGLSGTNDVRIISYSLPLSGLIYIRLGEKVYMNAAVGASIVIFPSDVRVITNIEGSSHHFQMEGAYRSKFQSALETNIGFEYRTDKYGYFYLGASYHLPFTAISTFAMSYEFSPGNVVSYANVRGSYATVDIRYFFPERKDKKVSEKTGD